MMFRISCSLAALAAGLLISQAAVQAQSGYRSSGPAYRPAPTPSSGSGTRATQPSSGSGTRAAQPTSGSGTRATQPTSGSGTRATQPSSGSGTRATQPAGGSGSREVMTKVGLDGYCPVCVVELKKWEKGVPTLTSVYDGVTYYFPNSAIKSKFDAAPEKYVPALNGDCIVSLQNMGKRVPGSVQFTALHRDRLYLFPDQRLKSTFLENPTSFEKADIAANGNCVVCLAKMSKEVPGSTEHTVIHEGKRYLFPSEKEADVFRQSPQQFVNVTAPSGGSGTR